MIQCQVKLRLTKTQEKECERWIMHLASIWNWAVRKIELNAKNRIYFYPEKFTNLLAGHSKKLGISGHSMQGVLSAAWRSWDRCFKKKSGKPNLKSKRNKMNWIMFPDPIKPARNNRFVLWGLGKVRFHKMDIPAGRIKRGVVVKRSSGWYLCLFIDAEPKRIERISSGEIGIDPGFKNLLTTSDGEIVEHPRELEAYAKRLAQAQRGVNKRLVGRIQERIANRRKDRNHKLSRRLVAENIKIAWSGDNQAAMSRKFGKSSSSSSHFTLRNMIRYKSALSGTEFIEVDSRGSTKTCSECGSRSGPTGLTGLRVRQWKCTECGTLHDRDINAAINTLIAAVGTTVEGYPVYAG